jgi:hypothetical protein
MPLPDVAARRLAHGRKGVRQEVRQQIILCLKEIVVQLLDSQIQLAAAITIVFLLGLGAGLGQLRALFRNGFIQLGPKISRNRAQFVIGQRLIFRFERIDRVDGRLKLANQPCVGIAGEFAKQILKHSNNSLLNFIR